MEQTALTICPPLRGNSLLLQLLQGAVVETELVGRLRRLIRFRVHFPDLGVGDNGQGEDGLRWRDTKVNEMRSVCSQARYNIHKSRRYLLFRVQGKLLSTNKWYLPSSVYKLATNRMYSGKEYTLAMYHSHEEPKTKSIRNASQCRCPLSLPVVSFSTILHFFLLLIS